MEVVAIAAQALLQEEENFLMLLLQLLTLLQQTLRIDLEPGSYCVLNEQQEIIAKLTSDSWDMKKHLRISRETFNHMILLLETPHRSGWDTHIKLAVFLFWLACGVSYHVISAVFSIPKTSVPNIVHEMLQKVNSLARRVIRIPSQIELREIGEGFAQLSRSPAFRIVGGAIDGCHVEVKVSGRNQADYFSRKLRYSIQFQAVCDHMGKFLHIFAGYPGSVHDSRVFRASPLFREGLYPPQGYVLLGDSGYPCIDQPISLLTPYREPVGGPVQGRYNAVHRRGRNVIERAFGMLKARWRYIFMQRLCVKHTKVAEIIGACCVMHNICLINGDILNEDEGEDDDNFGPPENNVGGCGLREQMANEISRVHNVPVPLEDHNYFAV